MRAAAFDAPSGSGCVLSLAAGSQGASLGRLARQEQFPAMERISDKNVLRFVPRAMVKASGAASRVEMNAKVRRP